MAFPDERARSLWAETGVRVWPETVILASLPLERSGEAADLVALAAPGFAALVVERDEASITVPEELWSSVPLRDEARAEAGPFRVLTFDLSLELDVCGYLAPAAVALAEAGVPIVPQCAHRTDHLLVPADKLETTLEALHTLIAKARQTP